MIRKLLPLLLCLIVAVAGCSKKEYQGPPVAGKEAPDLKLKGIDGQEISLSSLRGNVVFLNFWATWCPPCREEIPSIARLNTMMQGKPFRLVAVSIDEGGKGAVENLFQRMGVSLPTYLDPKGEAGRRYGLTGVPETFIIGKDGKILMKFIGPREWTDPEFLAFLESALRR
jgi:thiol-disulfide isomerase/thioredoxin